jgi:AraC family transcriptional regulator of arabinose operon
MEPLTKELEHIATPGSEWEFHPARVVDILSGIGWVKPGNEGLVRRAGMKEWGLMYTLDGRGLFRHARGRWLSQSGDLVLVTPGTPHDWQVAPTPGRWHVLNFFFNPRPHWLDWLKWPQIGPGYLHLSLAGSPLRGKVSRRLFKAHHWASQRDVRRQEFSLCALEEALLWCDRINPLGGGRSIDPRLRRALNFLQSHLAEKLSLEQIAESGDISVTHLGRLFRQHMNTTPIQYVERKRMERAMELLRDSSAIAVRDVAASVGYDDAFYFTNRFHRHVGMSPRAYRKLIDSRPPNSYELLPGATTKGKSGIRRG